MPSRGWQLLSNTTLLHATAPVQHQRFDAFGFDRCTWGTDWTRAVALLTYEQGVEAFRVTDRLSDSDRATLMGETLQRVYNWSPSQD
jgi:predicted TIM-barrel fold metal-dependent hydrolase